VGGVREVTPEETTVQVLIVWALALSTLINFGALIWNIFSGPSKKNGARLDAMAQTLAALDHRLSSVEQSQRVLPSKDDMHELELAMERLKGEMKTMSQVMAGQSAIMERMEAIVGRHEDHLLKKS
jgi:hypothetical protein